jgi:predicted RND superfamily exporter protein
MLALAIVYYTGGTVNAILLTMPSLVYVAATSGAIHLSNYYRDSLAEHGPVGAVESAVKHASLPLGLATGTTSVGLVSLCISDLVPIKMFGLYSAVGVVATLIPLLLILPAMLQTWPLRRKALLDSSAAAATAADDTADGSVPASAVWHNPIEWLPWRRVGEHIIHRHRAWAAACILAMVACGIGTTKIQTSVSLMRFFAEDAEIRQHYAWLEQHLGPLIPLEVVLRFDPQACQRSSLLERVQLVQRVERQISTVAEVGSTMSATTFVPDLRGARRGSTRAVALNTALAAHRDRLLDSGYFAYGGPQDEGAELWRISARVGALKDIDYGTFIGQIEAVVEPSLAQERQRRGGVPGEYTATYTGLVPLVYKAQHTLLDGLVIGFFGDWILVAVVMMVVVRDWSAGVLLMLPSMFPAAIVFGIMGWTGVIVDTGMVMTPAVALGVTVDDVVHFMLKYRKGLLAGMTRADAIMLAYRGGSQAMYQSWGVIGLGLAVFIVSPFMPTRMFGYMMVTLLTASLIGNLVMLPALLASPLGAVFTWTSLRQRDRRARRQQQLAERAALDTSDAHLAGAQASNVNPAEVRPPDERSPGGTPSGGVPSGTATPAGTAPPAGTAMPPGKTAPVAAQSATPAGSADSAPPHGESEPAASDRERTADDSESYHKPLGRPNVRQDAPHRSFRR